MYLEWSCEEHRGCLVKGRLFIFLFFEWIQHRHVSNPVSVMQLSIDPDLAPCYSLSRTLEALIRFQQCAQLWHHWCSAEVEPAPTALTAEAPLSLSCIQLSAGGRSVHRNPPMLPPEWVKLRGSHGWFTLWHSVLSKPLSTFLSRLLSSAARLPPGSGRTSTRGSAASLKKVSGRMNCSVQRCWWMCELTL